MIIRLDLRELEQDLGTEIQAFLEDLAVELVNSLKEEAPVGATGDLRRSFQIFREAPGVYWLGSRLHYAYDVWKGAPPHSPDFEDIKVWARRKLGDESAAGPVHAKIEAEGTTPNDYVGRALDEAIGATTR